MTILPQRAIVLVDPLTEYQRVIEAASKMKSPSSDTHDPYCVIAVRMTGIELSPTIQKFLPTETALYETGVDHLVTMHGRDVYSCTHELKLLEERVGVRIAGVVPLSEIAVDVSDMIAASLGLPHNPLDTVLCRRDKGFMKDIVAREGLRVAKFARIGGGDSSAMDLLRQTMERLDLVFPVVIKTPQGFSTTDVYICQSTAEAEAALDAIIGSIGPDGRPVQQALLEEYIDGTEFAVNLMACRDNGLYVTDVWKYEKDSRSQYISADICDPYDPVLGNVVEYAKLVARAVGVRYGAAHVELKAGTLDDSATYTDPVMIEIGARLSGGRKASMAAEAVPDWDPFTKLIALHCGEPFSKPGDGARVPKFTPQSFVRHIFLPVRHSGRIHAVEQSDMATLQTLHSCVTIVGVGDEVSKTTDITTCAGFVWLVGEKTLVDVETAQIRSEFRVLIEEDIS